jgi:hypothetical protein
LVVVVLAHLQGRLALMALILFFQLLHLLAAVAAAAMTLAQTVVQAEVEEHLIAQQEKKLAALAILRQLPLVRAVMAA